MLETFSYLLTNLINVATWRGYWLLADIYILPDRPDVSAGLTLVVGLGGLMLLLNGHSVAIRGCEMDGDALDEEGSFCPMNYLRYFVNQCRSRSVNVASAREIAVDINGIGKGEKTGVFNIANEVSAADSNERNEKMIVANDDFDDMLTSTEMQHL
jgi:hypothetical protein